MPNARPRPSHGTMCRPCCLVVAGAGAVISHQPLRNAAAHHGERSRPSPHCHIAAVPHPHATGTGTAGDQRDGAVLACVQARVPPAADDTQRRQRGVGLGLGPRHPHGLPREPRAPRRRQARRGGVQRGRGADGVPRSRRRAPRRRLRGVLHLDPRRRLRPQCRRASAGHQVSTAPPPHPATLPATHHPHRTPLFTSPTWGKVVFGRSLQPGHGVATGSSSTWIWPCGYNEPSH